MRYGTLIVLFVVIFTGCKSDKVELPEQVIPIPVIQGVWESMSCRYFQSSPPLNSSGNSAVSGFRFDTIYKTNNHIRLEITKTNKLIITYKNGEQSNISLNFLDLYEKDGNYLISTMIVSNNKELNFYYSKTNNSLSCEYNFHLLDYDYCVLPIENMYVNFIKK